MGLESRPYIGTWQLSGKQLIQHTPDAMVYLNGDTALPGCAKCSGKIDIQRFLTEVSVDAGTEPGSASASFSLSVPLHHTDSFARDAKFLLKPGLEVHVYMRGYFPVAGLYSHLAEGKLQNGIEGSFLAPEAEIEKTTGKGAQAQKPTKPDGTSYTQADFELRKKADSPAVEKRLLTLVATTETLHQYLEQQGYKGVKIDVADGYTPPVGHEDGSSHYSGKGFDFKAYDEAGEIDRTVIWASMQKLHGSKHLPSRLGTGVYLKPNQEPTSHPEWSGPHHMDFAHKKGGHTWVWVGGSKNSQKGAAWRAWMKALKPRITELADPDSTVGTYKQNLAGKYPGDLGEAEGTSGFVGLPIGLAGSLAKKGTAGPSLLEEYGLQGMGIENTLAYPYYHVFHGVVTEVSHSYSGGVNSVSVNCSSMLHFWQYQNMSTNASVFGARPRNSKLKMSMVGHNFTGMHPYQILYTLHHDMVGAAGGVGWALSSKSNQTAVSEVGQESYFTLYIKYWERRFAGSVTRLRMHGATGGLFSTMAAAWLGRTSSASILSVMRKRYNKLDFDNAKGVLGQSMAVGLMNKGVRKALAATSWSDRPKGAGADNKPGFELNMVEMQAFVSNIGNWGQVNLFESSYESKLDVAQKVMEITGFEFYQDVDGDFVFKPPMWNLDTSSSRVYRIEDIDIINISFSEKEPQVTYMTCKGSQFKNLGGTGLENEWGVRGQYIDYRLVAQFGWRPGTYETAYFNDSKSMFFSAVNRMDVMNIGINSASVTIPVRPELRPGFPVYIPYLDCYYYCNSFAHSHAVGGQCTTSLQLVGKRAKFYAPGRLGAPATGKGAIDLIDLGNPVLPQRPLLVSEEDGKPRLSGFPNVVMALDPTAINPMFFVVGNDAGDLSDVQFIRNLLKFGQEEARVFDSVQELENGGKIYTMTSAHTGADGKGTKVKFYFQEDDFKGEAAIPAEAQSDTTFNILAVAIDYEKLGKTSAKEAEGNQEKIDKLNAQIVDKQAAKAELQSSKERDEPATVANIAKLNKQVLKLEKDVKLLVAKFDTEKHAMEASWRTVGDPKSSGIAFLLEMVDKLGAAFRSSENFQGREDLTSTINLLDMLSDKKATFSNGSQPGSYRYYSASHPKVEHQAPEVVSYQDPKAKTKTKVTAPAPIDGPVSKILVYAKVPEAKFPGAHKPEAALVEGKPSVGIKVLNSNKNYPGGQSLATSDILELMFTVQPVTIVKSVTRVFRTTNIGTLGPAARAKIAELFTTNIQGKSPAPDESIKEYFGAQWDALRAKATRAIEAMKFVAAQGVAQTPLGSISLPSFPGTVQVYKVKVSTTTPLANITGEASLGAEGSKATATQVLNRAGAVLAAQFYRALEGIRRKAAKKMAANKVAGTEIDKVLNTFNTNFGGAISVAMSASNKRKGTASQKRTTTTFSPVFPVSDALGYEVIGSYRYGRGVGIEPNGVFDQMHKKDVFSLLDKHLVEQILQFFVQKKGYVQVPEMATTEVNGVKKTGPAGDSTTLKGGAAAKYLNDEVVRQLRARNLTDKQILDYGFLLNSDGDKGHLQFSLANIFADQKLDGVVKVPVINAAYSLADMNVQQSGHICDCKAAEADVEILAFGQKQYLQFSQSGTPHHEGLGGDPADAGTRWVATQAAQAANLWRQQQQALRGQVLDRGGSSIVQAFKDFGAAVTTGVEESYEQIQARLSAAAEKASVDWQNVKSAPEEDQ